MDFYLDERNVVERLVTEWLAHGKLIIAYDFDETVYDYHKKGHTFNDVIGLLRECKEFGAHLIVFTSCEEDKFPFIREYLTENNIPFDGINETPDFIPFKGRKVYYNILLDDRAGLVSAFNCLHVALNMIKHKIGTH